MHSKTEKIMREQSKKSKLVPEIPIASVVVQALTELQRLDLWTVRVLRDESLSAEYPDKVERALTKVDDDQLDVLARRVGLFGYQIPQGISMQAVGTALSTAIERGRESILNSAAYEAQIQRRFWVLAASCARQSPVFCRYVSGLPWFVSYFLAERGFDEAAASHMVEVMPLTQMLQSGKDFDSRCRSRQAWQMAVIALSQDDPHMDAIVELDCALLGGMAPRVPKVSEQAKWLSPTSLEVEFFVAQMLKQLTQTGVADLLSLVVPVEETEAAVQRIMRRYQGQLELKKAKAMKLSPAKKRKMPELVLKLLYRHLQDGFAPEEVVALLPYAAVHAAWILEIDPTFLGSAVWTDWCVRKLRADLCKLCGV